MNWPIIEVLKAVRLRLAETTERAKTQGSEYVDWRTFAALVGNERRLTERIERTRRRKAFLQALADIGPQPVTMATGRYQAMVEARIAELRAGEEPL